MSIDVTSTAMTTASAPIGNNKTNSTSDKAATDSSFKDEMNKVETSKSDTETKNETKETTASVAKKETKSETKKSDKNVESKSVNSNEQNNVNSVNNESQIINGQIAFNSQDAFNSANSLLQNDIAQMIENTSSIGTLKDTIWSFGVGEGAKSNLAMTLNDAQFFVNLTNTNDVSARNMFSQAQAMLNAGADTKQVAQNFKVSQALLNALSEARQNNQPLRIDFDQNISVILQINKGGEISARFIPGDKAVEQYLKNNIESLKATFDEQDLPYSELSYSNSSKEQNKRRRNEQQQGE